MTTGRKTKPLLAACNTVGCAANGPLRASRYLRSEAWTVYAAPHSAGLPRFRLNFRTRFCGLTHFIMQEKTVVKRSWLDLKSVQVALAVLALVIQYSAVLLIAPDAARSSQLIFDTFVGCIVATLVGIFFIRGVSQYPGVEASAYIVPSFSIAYAVLLATFILGRLEYSRILLTTSFVTNIVLFFLVFSLAGRRRRLRIGIVPEGRYMPPLRSTGLNGLCCVKPPKTCRSLMR